MLREVPVAFVAYDLLYRDGVLLLDLPFEERRQALEELLAGRKPPLLLARQRTADDLDAIDGIFHEARGRANEGLVLKARGSPYESGRRSGLWRKLKRPFGTLDVVVTAAEQGHGRRATVLSDYTFAVRDGERFVNVGKAYSGLTDEEIRALTRVFRKLLIQRFGRVLVVQPEVVLEVAFDGVQKSARHKSGFALRFPRILRWRQDKQPDEVDTIERVRELYDFSLQVLEDAATPPMVS
jgi:DNA ligase-1